MDDSSTTRRLTAGTPQVFDERERQYWWGLARHLEDLVDELGMREPLKADLKDRAHALRWDVIDWIKNHE